jgi:DNA-binding NarL/FixJ family response regulator
LEYDQEQIGQELFITEGTAGVHVSRILAKLGVAGRGEAAAIAHARPRRGMILRRGSSRELTSAGS